MEMKMKQSDRSTSASTPSRQPMNVDDDDDDEKDEHKKKIKWKNETKRNQNVNKERALLSPTKEYIEIVSTEIETNRTIGAILNRNEETIYELRVKLWSGHNSYFEQAKISN